MAREEGLIVADLAKAFDEEAEHRLPDARLFTDAVHWHWDYPRVLLGSHPSVDLRRGQGRRRIPVAREPMELEMG